MNDNKRYTSAEVATLVGIHKDTLLRWLRDGLIPEPTRDRHGWRMFTENELLRIKSYSEKGHTSNLDTASSIICESNPIIRKLEDMNWDFSVAKTSYLTHGMHPYPAKFIPQIPNALIQELSSVGDTVLDIFCGSGTTLVEALLLKRHAIGIDANPLACLMSRAKTSILNETDYYFLEELVGKVQDLYERIMSDSGTLSANPFKSSAIRPDSKVLDFWFDSFIIEELAEILKLCNEIPDDKARDIALVSFSAIIVTVSKQDSDTRYVRRIKNLTCGDAVKRFKSTLVDAIKSSKELSDLIEDRFNCSVYESNILDNPVVDQIDLMVCSPPYPNAYSYHLYHMTRMLWLGMDQVMFKKNEIGSHRKYSNKGKNRATIETFQKEMSCIFAWLRSVLKQDRYACFIIGNSTINGEAIDNATLLSEVAWNNGFTEVACIGRNIHSGKKSFNPRIGKIKTENILILQNTGKH